ncbi:MND1-interacting protein 1 [Nicotiana tabacum]|uniref:MND1-interacting protein 1 n=1 Tax=Nicotiana tabacum TaxID=4097 RepID=A0A1S4BW53_TOBAC|nr:MND1-interacting protein 1 [Nicotiana tomentosiformis]XP_016493107.1 PREDICTED: MND1-interacting protein 1-like [Nicotiana tabacum]
MGSKEKYTRTNRRPRSVKTEHDHNAHNISNGNSVFSESGLSPLGPIKPNTDGVDESGWGYCTEEQLEEILLQNLEILYSEAINKLIGLGYDEDVAMKAILKNGHCYGGMDVLTNILHNSLSYLNNGSSVSKLEDSEHCFVDLRQLEEYSLAGMVCLLQQVKPHLSKGDAMWCLLMSDLHVGRASVMEIPAPSNGNGCVNGSVSGSGNVEGVGMGPVGVVPAMCRFHGGWGFGSGGANNAFPLNRSFAYTASDSNSQKEIECPKRFNLTPSMKTLLKRNVAAFAAGFRSNPKYMQNQSQACPSSLADGDQSCGSESGVESGLAQSGDSHASKSQDVVNSVVGKFRDLNLDGNTEKGNGQLDQKDEMILSLIDQIKDLEKQVKERKDWAHQKAMQAARKLSNDLTELKTLRMEREDTQRLKKGKQAVEDTTMKRLAEMENALRKASGQVDRANLAVKKLENENAEIRAEMEASKLSASESAKTCMEAAKREKKCIKKLGVWEKQKKKLQEDIAAEKQKISDVQKQLVQVEAAQKEAEAKWRQEQKAKEQAVAQVEEEQRLKEAAEATNKRKLEALRLKIEIDFQRHKDDLQRLEQDLSRLKASTELQNQSANLVTGNSNGEQPHADIARMLHELDRLENSSEKGSSDRECLICKKDEVSIVFLPCAHQVMCANCNDKGKKGRAKCPCCGVPIEQRIRVFGATS